MKKIITLLILAAFFAMPVHASYESYIETALRDGIISGDENGNVDNDRPATRAEFAVILTKFLNLSGGINTFSDVSAQDWFASAMATAGHYSIIVGDENGNAKPYDMIKRMDVITMLGRFYGAANQNISPADGVADYAQQYWAYAVSNHILTNESPDGFVSKGEILQLLYSYDTEDEMNVRFMSGYPKISQKSGVLNHISVEIRTNKPCKIYYALTEENSPHKEVKTLLCETSENTVTASIKANINKTYDIFLLAVDSDGVSGKISVIKGARPFAIASGDGSRSTPYILYTKEQLSQISLMPNKFYRLGSDITLDGEWTPISDFTGTLDGNGYTIRGLTVSGKNHAGLFSHVSGTVKNLTVYGDMTAAKNVGIIAGTNDGNIENCTVAGTAYANTDYAGGICGVNCGTVKNCLTSLYSVASGSFAGGISGINYGIIENCLAAVNVVASDMYAGGIAGVNSGGTIKACVSACMTVHDVLTRNSGRITTNKNDGILDNNYFYLEAISDTMYVEPSRQSQNGFDATWDNLRDLDFYRSLGWNTGIWKTADNGFRLVYPKPALAPDLSPGDTIYFPKQIKTEHDLRAIDSGESGHYILAADIYLSAPWKTICGAAGFSGTLDGDGHTIYNLNLNTQPGFFSNITGGTVKNLTLRNVTASSDTVGGILTPCNYGYIDNCQIYGKIQAKRSGHIGSFTGLNHGAITNCRAYVDITNTHSNSTIGGICAESDGVIFSSSYRGKISATSENTVAGGICGYDTGGYISDCFAFMTASTNTNSVYIGGICGMAEGSQIYKCVSGGNIIMSSKDIIYSGGICALAQNTAIYNCYSLSELHAFSRKGYVGGICGLNSESNVQNTYSAASILSGQSIITGGICGFSENGFIMQNVALNPAINGGENTGAIYGKSHMSGISDNYACDRILINSQHIVNRENNGIIKSLDTLKNTDFYFKPISLGGLLGWPCDIYGDDVWQNSLQSYAFPTLSGVDTRGLIAMPKYK